MFHSSAVLFSQTSSQVRFRVGSSTIHEVGKGALSVYLQRVDQIRNVWYCISFWRKNTFICMELSKFKCWFSRVNTFDLNVILLQGLVFGFIWSWLDDEYFIGTRFLFLVGYLTSSGIQPDFLSIFSHISMYFICWDFRAAGPPFNVVCCV